MNGMNTSGQLVYSYNETQIKFGGCTEAFFASQVREDNRALTGDSTLKNCQSILVAEQPISLLHVINWIRVQVATLKLFQHSYSVKDLKIAGDDILLDIIQICVLPALRTALTDAGISDADAWCLPFCSEGLDAGQQVLRQQFILQIFNPIKVKDFAIGKLRSISSHEGINSTFGEF